MHPEERKEKEGKESSRMWMYTNCRKSDEKEKGVHSDDSEMDE
jgi:hypothetical protein